MKGGFAASIKIRLKRSEISSERTKTECLLVPLRSFGVGDERKDVKRERDNFAVRLEGLQRLISEKRKGKF